MLSGPKTLSLSSVTAILRECRRGLQRIMGRSSGVNIVSSPCVSFQLMRRFPSDLQTEPLTLTSGVIWTALNIDYPGHSFSHLGIFHGAFLAFVRHHRSCLRLEGLNGHLPNQDLLNSVAMISRHTGGVPVVLYNHLDTRDSADKSYPPSWLRPITQQSSEIFEYVVRARNIARHFLYQSSGAASGVHGLYHRFASPKIYAWIVYSAFFKGIG